MQLNLILFNSPSLSMIRNNFKQKQIQNLNQINCISMILPFLPYIMAHSYSPWCTWQNWQSWGLLQISRWWLLGGTSGDRTYPKTIASIVCFLLIFPPDVGRIWEGRWRSGRDSARKRRRATMRERNTVLFTLKAKI